MSKSFSVTARVWKDLPFEKGAIIHSLSDLFNVQLQLSEYGSGVVEFNFTAIIEPQEFFPTKYRYVEGSKRLDAEIRLDYDRAITSSLEAFKGIVAQQYLNTIDHFESKNISNFNFDALKQDVEALFFRQGWMVSA